MSGGAPGGAGLDRRLLAVASVVILGAIMTILDTTIVNVAIDTLSRRFHSKLATIQWVSTGYMLALATVIPLTGWAADRFGTKRLWIISVSLFLVGSALSGLAWSAESLIVFRILQGLGGGMVMPAGMTVLAQAAGPQRVGRVMSVVGVPMLLGPVLGPVLGGLLIDDVSWRWIFFVNLPIGAVALPLAWRVLERDVPKASELLDVRGFLLLSPGLALFVYGLAQIASEGSVRSTFPLVAAIVGAAMACAFVLHALRARQPLLDVRLFRARAFSAAVGTTFLFAAAMFGAMLLLPLYFQIVRSESPLTAGLLLAPQGLGASLVMPIAGRITDRSGAGRVVLIGLVFLLGSMFGLAHISATTGYVPLVALIFLSGMGMGATMMPAMSAAYQTLAPAAVARATTILNIIMRLGASMGIALLAVVLQHEITSLVPQTHGGGIGAAQAAVAHGHAAITVPLATAFSHTFWWGFGAAAAAFFPALLLPRRRFEPAPEPGTPSEGALQPAP